MRLHSSGPGGVSGPGGGVVSAPGGVPAPGGGFCSRGCLLLGIPACTEADRLV